MDSRDTILLVIICVAVSLLGCQNLESNQMLYGSDTSHKIKQVSWKKSGELFFPTVNDNLKENESRIVFFRDADDSEKPHNINIRVGLDNAFQASLQKGHYSEEIICDSSHVINASVLKENGDVISYSENFQFTPQATTYLKVNLSEAGRPIIQQISADKALSALRQSIRQTHQISRVSSDCSLVSQRLPSQELSNQNLSETGIKESMANNPVGIKNLKFLESYPKNDVILKGYADNKDSKGYNIELS